MESQGASHVRALQVMRCPRQTRTMGGKVFLAYMGKNSLRPALGSLGTVQCRSCGADSECSREMLYQSYQNQINWLKREGWAATFSERLQDC